MALCPVVVTVRAAIIAGAPNFHRIVMEATVNTTSKFKFSMPVGEGEQVDIDVSSALRTVAERQEYTADNLNPYRWTPPATEEDPAPTPIDTYPHLSLLLEVWDEYQIDGDVRTTQKVSYVDSGYYLAGALTDRERLTGERPIRFSRKPTTSREICFAGAKHLIASQYTLEPTVGQITVPTGDTGAANIYGIAWPQHGYELRFINSMGVHENVFIHGLPSKNASISTDRYVIARQETFTKFSRLVSRKHSNRETWHFSSGALDEAWQRWYIHELLMAEQMWIKIDDAWIECQIAAGDDSITITDAATPGMMQVEFDLELGLNGSPLA